jgi:adenylate cyclase
MRRFYRVGQMGEFEVSMMKKIKDIFFKQFENMFVLLVLVGMAVIVYLVQQKLAFLNFFFIPVFLAANYLGQRRAFLGAMLCIFIVFGFVLYEPRTFIYPMDMFDMYAHVGLWSAFLVIAAGILGKLEDKLKVEIKNSAELNEKLQSTNVALNDAHLQLIEHNKNLEKRVEERTAELAASKDAIENLKKKVEDTLYSTMDSTVVNMIIEGRLRNEKRPISILFSDLVSFTTYSESTTPENVLADLNRYFQDMEPIMLSYHGHIDKFMGDGIMCEFGAPREFSTHRLMATLCGWKMQQVLKANKYPWQMRIGIASGSAIVGMIGGNRRQGYTAIGDIVNTASRLESQCPHGSLLVDHDINEDIKDFFETRRLRDPNQNRSQIETQEEELAQLSRRLKDAPNHPVLLHRIGKLQLLLGLFDEATASFLAAIKHDPGNNEYKIAYADAALIRKDKENIAVKGKRARVEAYEVLALRDPLDNRNKIPLSLFETYGSVLDRLTVPNDLLLPSESLDGSVGHSKVVAVLCFAIADAMNLPEQDKTDILLAGYLADIGKERVPHHLLNRRGSLNTAEYDEVLKHSEESCRMMRKMGYEQPAVLEYVRHSHDKFRSDEGLEPPLGARIIAVADVYDALTSKRPYRDAWERSAAIGEIRRDIERGVYDPHVVETLARLVK